MNAEQNKAKVQSMVRRASNKELKISEDYIKTFWRNRSKDQVGLDSRLEEMSKYESWTKQNHIELRNGLDVLGKVLSDVENISDEAFLTEKQIESLLTILAYFNSSFAFRIINWLDENRNPVMTKLVTRALESAASTPKNTMEYITPEALLVERMATLNMMGFIHEVFNPEVTGFIKKVLNEFEDEARKSAASVGA